MIEHVHVLNHLKKPSDILIGLCSQEMFLTIKTYTQTNLSSFEAYADFTVQMRVTVLIKMDAISCINLFSQHSQIFLFEDPQFGFCCHGWGRHQYVVQWCIIKGLITYL